MRADELSGPQGSGRQGERPLRVLYVTARFFPYLGGIETHVFEVSRRFAARGVDVTVLTTDTSGKLAPEEVIDGVRVRRVPAYPAERDYYYAPGLRTVIADAGRWDIVHCQGAHTFVPLLAMRAALRARLPYVLTFHAGGDVTAWRGLIRGAQWRALRPYLARASRLIGVTQDEAQRFQRTLNLPWEQFAVVHNGASHMPRVAPEPSLRRGAPQIVSVGRLERYKGHQRVIAAMPHILQRYPDARLKIVGKGSYEEALRKLTRRLRLESRVEIGSIPAGDTDGMAAAFASADVVTLLSEHEGEGIVVLEALALGRPVVVAYATALREFADQGMARAVSLQGTDAEVAATIIQQIERPLAPAHFEPPTWEACVDALFQIYTEAVSPQPDQGALAHVESGRA